jgi:hypothetical protein
MTSDHLVLSHSDSSRIENQELRSHCQGDLFFSSMLAIRPYLSLKRRFPASVNVYQKPLWHYLEGEMKVRHNSKRARRRKTSGKRPREGKTKVGRKRDAYSTDHVDYFFKL